MGLWDTAGQEDYDRLRPLSYPQTDVFLVCFSVSSRASFENAKSKWVQELRHHAPGTPFMLVGTKADLRNGQSVTAKEAEAAARTIGAIGYAETSALNLTGVSECFERACAPAIASSRRKSVKKCGGFGFGFGGGGGFGVKGGRR